MYTTIDFASIAYYVYHNKKGILKYMPNKILHRKQYNKADFLKNLHSMHGIVEVIIEKNVQLLADLRHDFYGSVFFKVEQGVPKSVLIGLRGTVPSILGNDWADVHSWWKNIFSDTARINCPHYLLNQSAYLCLNTMSFAIYELGLSYDKIFVCGHSLGGALAALIPCKIGLPIRAITFNAPGIKSMANLQQHHDQVLNLRAKYDFVSAIADPIGPVFDLDVPEQEQLAKEFFDVTINDIKKALIEETADPWTLFKDEIEFSIAALAQHKMLNLWKTLRNSSISNLSYSDLFQKKQEHS